MAAKKNYYAVKKGKTTGIFSSWEECKTAVDGYPGAEYKGFVTLIEAEEYLGAKTIRAKGAADRTAAVGSNAVSGFRELPEEGKLLAYVDGSYEDSVKRYAFGCVFILHDGRIYTQFGNGDNLKSARHRNVTGEMLGAMYAVKTALFNGFQEIEICYDYQGIEKWVTGEWRSKVELTQKYAAAMRTWSRDIAVTFTKVPAHSHVKYNELADQMAKKGLTDADGVPKVGKLEELTLYEEEA